MIVIESIPNLLNGVSKFTSVVGSTMFVLMKVNSCREISSVVSCSMRCKNNMFFKLDSFIDEVAA
jgi:hypothetical protein